MLYSNVDNVTARRVSHLLVKSVDRLKTSYVEQPNKRVKVADTRLLWFSGLGGLLRQVEGLSASQVNTYRFRL